MFFFTSNANFALIIGDLNQHESSTKSLAARVALKTVPMTLTSHCDTTEGDCCSDYVVTVGTCVERRAFKARILHCQDTQRLLAWEII